MNINEKKNRTYFSIWFFKHHAQIIEFILRTRNASNASNVQEAVLNFEINNNTNIKSGQLLACKVSRTITSEAKEI